MPRGWPPLKHAEVEAILTALGLRYSGKTSGGHAIWKGVRNGTPTIVPVSTHIKEFGVDLLNAMCKQARSNRKEFYGATPSTKAKIT